MRRALLATCSIAAVLIACGSRGPLDDGYSVVAVTTDGGGDGSSTTVPDAATIVDAGRPDAGPLACAGCVVNTCGQQIVDCVGDAACLGVFTCITSTCLPTGDAGGAGGINTTCLLGCATKNPTGALQVIQIFQCVTGTCSSDCGDLLGGLGGGLGGLGGLLGGGQKIVADGPSPFEPTERGPVDREAFDQVFSPWPELTSGTK